MKYLTAILLTILSCSSVQKTSVETQGKSAVKITHICLLKDGNWRANSGSGVAVSPTQVLTANHVTECPTAIQQIFIHQRPRNSKTPGQVSMGTLEFRMAKFDIAKITIDLKEPKMLTYIQDIAPMPKVNDKVCYEPASPNRYRDCGIVQAINNNRAGANITHSAVTQPGNSGSGMYNEQGQLVGLITRMYLCKNLAKMGIPQICGGITTSLEQHKEIIKENNNE